MTKAKKTEEMQISEAELNSMTAHMVEMHEATFPVLKASLTDLGSSLRSSRRSFMIGGGAVAGGVLLAACGSSSKNTGSGGGGGTPTTSASADAAALKTNASIEALAIFAYTQALAAAPKGKFGKTVPAAVATFAQTALAQHKDHLAAFNGALTNAGGTAYTTPTPSLAPTVTKLFTGLNSVPGLAALALELENTAAATYINQLSTLTSKDAIAAVATIAPVERQHAAILSYVLGDYPVPDTFVLLNKTTTSLGAQPNISG